MRKLVYLKAKSIIMKTLKPIVLSIAIAISTFSYGQTSENPWAIAVGADLINLQGDNVDSGLNFGAPALSLKIHWSWIFNWCTIRTQQCGKQ